MSQSALSLPPAVLLGGSLNAVSAARSLTGMGVEVVVLGDTVSGAARYSRRVAAYVEPDSPELQEQWLTWLRSAEPAVIIPCCDDGLELVARNRAVLEATGHLVPESNDEVLLAMLDKARTYELARRAGVRSPMTMRVETLDDLTQAGSVIGFPCALKPRESHRWARSHKGKVSVAHDLDELLDDGAALLDEGLAMIVTEIIPGPDDALCSYYTWMDPRGVPLFHFTKRKLRQLPIGFGTGTMHMTAWDPQVADLGLRLFTALGVRGLANVEFKRDERNGQLVLIECNLRLTAANDLVRRAGIDLARFAYCRAVGLPTQLIDGFRDDLYQWLPRRDIAAFLAYRREGQIDTSTWLRSLANRHTSLTLFSWSDPKPAIASVSKNVRRVVSGRAPRYVAAPARSTRVLGGLAKAGKAGSHIGLQLDVARALGPSDAWRHRRHLGAAAEIDSAARVRIYADIWAHAAREVGAELEELSGGFTRLSRGGRSTVVFQNLVPIDNPVVLHRAGAKATAGELLTDVGIPVPDHVLVDGRRPDDVVGALERFGTCVVKPTAGTGRGTGVTCGVRTPDEIHRAVLRASRWDAKVMVERQAVGNEYRVLVLGDRVLDVLRRRPPSVVGDGRSTIGQLLERENDRRLEAMGTAGMWPIRIDLDCVFTLRRGRRSLHDVPDAGERVQMKTAVNENGPDDNTTVWPIPPAVKDAAVSAARALGVRFGAVEIITPDVSLPLAEAGGTVVEVNTTPGFHYHYQVDDPPRLRPVAVPLLEHLLTDGASTGDRIVVSLVEGDVVNRR